jgi:hypothetical protein
MKPKAYESPSDKKEAGKDHEERGIQLSQKHDLVRNAVLHQRRRMLRRLVERIKQKNCRHERWEEHKAPWQRGMRGDFDDGQKQAEVCHSQIDLKRCSRFGGTKMEGIRGLGTSIVGVGEDR